MDAAKHFKQTTCKGKRCLLKLVKLKDDPTPNELEIQLKIINTNLEDIFKTQKSLNIVLENPKKEEEKKSPQPKSGFKSLFSKNKTPPKKPSK